MNMTVSGFRKFMEALITQYSLTPRTIGEYLRALWAAIGKHTQDTVTYSLLARLLESAYVIEPLPFDPKWLNIQPLGWSWDGSSGSYIIKEFDEKDRQWRIQEQHVDPFRILQHTLLSQISERYLIENTPETVTEQQRTRLKNDWSNPDPYPYPYLQAALFGLYSDASDAEEQTQDHDLDWGELAAILSVGKVCD